MTQVQELVTEGHIRGATLENQKIAGRKIYIHIARLIGELS